MLLFHLLDVLGDVSFDGGLNRSGLCIFSSGVFNYKCYLYLFVRIFYCIKCDSPGVPR